MHKLEENKRSNKSNPLISIFYRNSTRNLTSWETKLPKLFWRMRGNTNKLNNRISSSPQQKCSKTTLEVLKRIVTIRLRLRYPNYLVLPWTISNTKISWYSLVCLQRLILFKKILKKDHCYMIFGRFCMEKKMSTSILRICEWWSKSFRD